LLNQRELRRHNRLRYSQHFFRADSAKGYGCQQGHGVPWQIVQTVHAKESGQDISVAAERTPCATPGENDLSPATMSRAAVDYAEPGICVVWHCCNPQWIVGFCFGQ
jgi:hypothetical protein